MEKLNLVTIIAIMLAMTSLIFIALNYFSILPIDIPAVYFSIMCMVSSSLRYEQATGVDKKVRTIIFIVGLLLTIVSTILYF